MRRLFTGLAVPTAIALVSCATVPGSHRSAGAAPAADAKPALEAGATGRVTLSAKVVRVDPAKRLVTLEAPDGQRVTVRVHAHMANLDTLQPGDVVRATYYESVAYDVRAPGAAPPRDAPPASPAAAPEAIESRSVTVTARVAAVNESAGTLTLQAPDADPLTIRVKRPGSLKAVKPGDLADVTLSEAIAVAIEKLPPR